MLTDSPGSLAHHVSVIVFHSTQTYADMIKTRSPETESEKYSFLKSSTSASPRPTSPSFKEFMPLLEESLLNTKADSSFQSSDDSSISPKETEKERSDNFLTFVTPKKSSPSSDDSSIIFKIPGTSQRFQSPLSSSSGEETVPIMTWKKKYIAKYMSNDISIRRSSSLKPFSKLSIDSKDLGKIYRSKTPECSSDSAESITSEIEFGKSKSFSFRKSKRLSSSARACIE
ncbi:hypothetical protein TNCT_359751 [Trichonephila clavata]|uniref:Uncharacterized protein n=1 Tax=Trichonephila clavata TaxID=2740835 RepID=A0A8X6LQM8_TRICU|nr:hypothetical protein TNCT_359751 [Trichonephila clavata]